MQNPYNNFLKRQKQTSTNNFKEKIANSLSGKTLNNTTMPNTSNPVANKLRANMNVVTQGSTSRSNNAQPVNNTNTQQIITTPPVANTTPQNTMARTVTPTTSNITTPVENNIENVAVSDVPVTTSATGMMSLSDINNTISPKARTTTNTTSYKDLLEQNKNDQLAQADKNWATQEDAFNKQMENLQNQYQQSVNDTNKAYQESVDTLNQQRYNQMEELNISGTNRGIQYSPQQLGLENVANINHNKNLAETSKSRNELLNKLQIELQNSLTQLNTTIANSRNEYNKNKLDITSNYYNTLVGWGREDELTQSDRDWEQKLLEEKRAWEEAQALKDKEWEKQMQELQNKFEQQMQDSQNSWQSGENKLDREHETNLSKSRSSGGYSSGYGGYSRSYTPYSRSYYNGYNSYSDAASLDDEITQQAIDNTFKQVSTDAYNASDMGYVDSLMDRASVYNELIDPMYSAYYGKNDTVSQRLDNTRETALKHLLNKSIARSTNSPYQIGDTIYQPNAPLRQSYIDKVNKHKNNLSSRYYNRFSKDDSTKFRYGNKAKLETSRNLMNDYRNRNSNKNTDDKETKSNKTTKISKTQQKVAKAVSNSTKNTKKAVANSVKNTKKATTNATKNVKKNTNTKTSSAKTQKAISNSKKNVKKSLNNSKKNTKKSKNNSLKNLKKNISKLFGK